MFSSLRFRLWLSYALVVGVVLLIAVVTILIYLWRNPTSDRQELQRLRLVSSFILQRTQVFNFPGLNNAEGRLQETVTRLDNATGARVAVYAPSGQPLVDSRARSEPPLPQLSVLNQQSRNTVPVFRDSERQQWLYVLTPMQDGDYLMVSSIRKRLPALGALRDELLGPFMRGAALALVLALFLAVWIAHWVASPLRNMTNAARHVASGEFRQIQVGGPGEVKTLAHAFNEMVDRVHASQRSQRDFVANVSHDLKTPLTSIQGFAQAILDGTADDPEALRQSAQVIYDEAGRMNRMVMDLLELARLDSGMAGFEKVMVAIKPLLDSLLENFALQAREKEVKLELACEDNLPSMIADPDRLAQVFTNLLDNALKYTPAGGEVLLSARRSDDLLEIAVADSGPGIPAADLDRIFERFYQTDKSRPGGEGRGVGLGLAIAREIVLAHGGSISAYNVGGNNQEQKAAAPGSGSVFVVKLPFVSGEQPATALRQP